MSSRLLSYHLLFSLRPLFSCLLLFFHRPPCFLDCKLLGVLSSTFLGGPLGYLGYLGYSLFSLSYLFILSFLLPLSFLFPLSNLCTLSSLCPFPLYFPHSSLCPSLSCFPSIVIPRPISLPTISISMLPHRSINRLISINSHILFNSHPPKKINFQRNMILIESHHAFLMVMVFPFCIKMALSPLKKTYADTVSSATVQSTIGTFLLS